MKKCCTCKEFKNESEFHKNKNTKDGLHDQCKVCFKNYYQENKEGLLSRQKIYCQTHKEEMNAYKKIYRQTPEGKKAMIKGNKKYIKKFPEKHRAHWKLSDAIKRGMIIKPKICSICGKTNCKIESHHTSYKKGDELKVVWCCVKCHKDLHNLLIKKDL